MSSNDAPLPDRSPRPPRPPLPMTPPPVGTVEHDSGLGPVAAEFADVADARDRLAARALGLLFALRRDPAVLDGLSPQVWLEQACRMTRGEARRLLATADVVQHLPAVVAGLQDGRLSWSQTVALARAARDCPADRRAELDAAIAGALDQFRGYEPDELVDQVWLTVAGWAPSRLERDQAAAERAEHLTLMPRLFDGGAVYGEFGPAHFALIAEALDAPVGPPVAADLDDPDSVEDAYEELDDRRQRFAQAHAQQVAQRFVALCEDSLAGWQTDGERIAPRPTAFIVTTAEALLDRDRTPGWMLTTLTGGRLKANSTLIQQLVDQRGADLRGVILDDTGQLVGVGRKTHIPPRWVREAIWALDLADQAPGSTTPVRRADLDHILPFEAGGTTDAANLQPTGRTLHRAKTGPRATWDVTRTRDGTATWTHRRTGFQIHNPPTWRRLTHDPPDPGPPRLPLDDLTPAP